MDSKEDAIIRLKTIHKDKYEYEINTDLVRSHDKIGVICPIHGLFYQEYRHHLKGVGCKACANIAKNEKRTLTTEEFIERSKKVHGDKYDYSKTEYINSSTKVVITCPKHGDFKMLPFKHLGGQGCKTCKKKYGNTEDFINVCKEIHGDTLSYDKVDFHSVNVKVTVTCPIHGDFEKYPYQLVNRKEGCPFCASEKVAQKQMLTKEGFISRYYSRYGKKYDLSDITYNGSNERINVYCTEKYASGKEHGYFSILASNLMAGYGCPICSRSKHGSKGQEEIAIYIESLGFDVIQNYKLNDKYELDIYVPELKIAFEYNGLFWHSETHRPNNYHRDKTNLCVDNNIKLIHIFEDEWEFKQDIVKSRICSILGKNKKRIYARDCDVMEISNGVASKFINRNHIQGNAISKYRYGLYHDNKLVAVMTFCKLRKNLGNRKYKPGYYELLRFCTKRGVSVVGGASKLLKYFIKMVNPHHIVSYADRRWSEGNMYKKIGFKWIRNTKPNYYYIVDKKRENRFKYRKSELVKQGFDRNRTEHEIMLERKIYRIYDCGTMVFEMKIY